MANITITNLEDLRVASIPRVKEVLFPITGTEDSYSFWIRSLSGGAMREVLKTHPVTYLEKEGGVSREYKPSPGEYDYTAAPARGLCTDETGETLMFKNPNANSTKEVLLQLPLSILVELHSEIVELSSFGDGIDDTVEGNETDS